MSTNMPNLVLQDQAYGSQAKIQPGAGFNCFSFQVPIDGKLVEILSSEPGFEQGDKKGTRSGIPLLFPFPNRIQGGLYSWDGKEYQLPATDGHGNAIHGFVVDRPWRVITADSKTAIAEFQLSLDAPDRLPMWPSDFLIEVKYSLSAARLRADIRIVNAGDSTLPWGFGTHPYFNIPILPDGDSAECQIQVPADESWELKDFIPTGRRIPVEPRVDLRNGVGLHERKLDDVLTGLQIVGGRTSARVIDRSLGFCVTQSADSVFQECVVFTPPGRPCVCLEPYTCTTNAINLQQQGIAAGWRVLAPRAEFRTWIEIAVSPNAA
jgi:aldose 1-epimerase